MGFSTSPASGGTGSVSGDAMLTSDTATITGTGNSSHGPDETSLLPRIKARKFRSSITKYLGLIFAA